MIMTTQQAVEKAYRALEIERKIVGVKFLTDEQEFAEADAQLVRNRVTYCVMVKLAMKGYERKAALDQFSCLSAARALGITEPETEWLSGEQYCQRGMYADQPTSKRVVERTSCIQQKNYGVMVKPLEKYTENPDTVLIVTTPYNIMRLIQGYTYTYGTYSNYQLIGNQAFCSECTAYPFENDDINISVMCAGTRYMAGWGKDEMALGVSFSKFVGMIDGLYRTINIMEPDADKKIIDKKLQDSDCDDLQIVYGKNYYTGLYRK